MLVLLPAKWVKNVEGCWYCVRFVSACDH